MTVPSSEAKPVDMDGRAFLALCYILAYFLGSLGSKANLATRNHWESVLTISELKWYILRVYPSKMELHSNTVKPVLSGHRIKRTPSIKRTVAEVPKFVSLIYFK